MAHHSAHTTAPLALLRRYLGLTQPQLAAYLGTHRVRVADDEAQRRLLSRPASRRLTYLCCLLPPDWEQVARPRPLPPDIPPSPTILALAPPDGPLSPAAVNRLKRQQLNAAHSAYRLRFQLPDLAHRLRVNQHRRALLTAFETSTEAATRYRELIPDDNPARTVRFQHELTSLIEFDELSDGPLNTVTLALDRLRLHLLEAEAATLAAWLGE